METENGRHNDQEGALIRLPKQIAATIFQEMQWFTPKAHTVLVEVVSDCAPARSYGHFWRTTNHALFPASHLPWNRNRRPKKHA
jgi:hypothetical protein